MFKSNGLLHFGLTLLGILIFKICLADVNITYVVQNYRNPNNLDDRLKKCESLDLFGDHCDPVFYFTSYTYTDQWQQRAIFRMKTGPILNTKFVDNIMSAYDIQSAFPDAVEIELDIEDSDVDENQRIARFRRQVPLDRKGKYELKMGVDVKVEVVIQVECATEYYGEHCETYCVPLNGLWECDPKTGARICTKQCKHGHCELTSTGAICACPSGWSGDLCQTQLQDNIIASLSIPQLPLYRESLPFEKIKPFSPKQVEATDPTPTTTELVRTITEKKTEQQKFVTNKPIIQNKTALLKATTTTTTPTTISTPIETTTSTSMCPGCYDQTSDNVTTISGGAGTLIEQDTRNFWIPIVISGCVTFWIFVIVLAGFVYYRRRRRLKTEISSGTLWTNSVYGMTSFGGKRPLSVEYSKSAIDRSNRSIPNQFNLLLNRPIQQRGVLRNASTLPRLPNETRNHRPSVRYVRPVGRGTNRLRFGTVSFAPYLQNSLSTSSVQSGLTMPECLTSTTDTYEEVDCTNRDYSTWSSRDPDNKKLTSFQ